MPSNFNNKITINIKFRIYFEFCKSIFNKILILKAEVSRIKNPSRNRTSQSVLNNANANTKLAKVNTEPYLEVRNLLQSSPSKLDDGKVPFVETPKLTEPASKNQLLKQVNERRNTNATNSSSNVIAPYTNFYNSKNPNEIIENITRDLNRKSSFKSSKIQSQLIQQQHQSMLQKQYLQQQTMIGTSQFQSPSFTQLQPPPQTSPLTNLKIKNPIENKSTTTARLNDDTHSNVSTSSATLFSSAFVAMNGNPQIKSQFEKISTRATANANATASLIPNTIRQKIYK